MPIPLKIKDNKFPKEIEDMLRSASKLSTSTFYSGKIKVDFSQNRIVIAGKEQILQPKVMQLLLFLCAADGKTLNKAQLNELLWPDVQVGPDSLANTITRLRRALTDNSKQPQFIETVQRKGYRWILPVIQINSNASRKINRIYWATLPLLLVGVSIIYWQTIPDAPKFPFQDLSIERKNDQLEVKVGIEQALNQQNEAQIKQEISRITGHDPAKMKISIDPECSQKQIQNNQIKDCVIPSKKSEPSP